MFGMIRIRPQEVGLLFRRGSLKRVLAPGTHRFFGPPWLATGERVEVFDVRAMRFAHPLLSELVEVPALARHLFVLELGEDERAFLWQGDVVVDTAGPGLHAWWRAEGPFRVERWRIGSGGERTGGAPFARPRLGDWLDGMRVARTTRRRSR